MSTTTISALGTPEFSNPLQASLGENCKPHFFVSDKESLNVENYDPSLAENSALSFELAGPREKLFFDPTKTRAAIVTCGGLCPGLNDVIRSLVITLNHQYGISDILGIRFGYHGFTKRSQHAPLRLTPETVEPIHRRGGTILGSSRGAVAKEEILAFLKENNIQLLFTIGGDGTLRAADELATFAQSENYPVSVIGIPKTIDNDIPHIDRSFGFETAFSEAVKSISCAQNEASGAFNGIGLVKLMGRHSGFIACHAALAMNDVDFVLIPEAPFQLEGENGLLSLLEKRARALKHSVILVAEGAGQEHFPSESSDKDASGNLRLHDIGKLLKEKIKSHFEQNHLPVNIKYIDPSYIIRSVPATPRDSEYALRLAEHAVHAAMAGKTHMVIAQRHNRYVHVPMSLIANGRKQVDIKGDLWFSVLQATEQPLDHFTMLSGEASHG